jgi:Na+/pantothenate symporter
VASKGQRDLLSIGIVLVIVVVGILLWQPLQVIDWTMIVPFVIFVSGCWVVVLAGMQSSNPQKYGMNALTILGWGVLLVAIGGAWFLYYYSWIYSVIVVLLAFAALAIGAALKRK